MKRISLILVIVVLSSAALLAWEGQNHERLEQENQGQRIHPRKVNDSGNKGFGMRMEMIEELELTDKQIEKLGTIKTAHLKQNIQLKADLEILQIDKREAMKTKNFTAAKKVNAEISKLRLQMNISQIDQQESIWNELTDKQKEKATKLGKTHHMQKNMKKFKKEKHKMM